MRRELWLEFGYNKDNNYEDMLWYNEGRANEFFYFIKNLLKKIINKKMYFKMRFYNTKNIYLKRGNLKKRRNF